MKNMDVQRRLQSELEGKLGKKESKPVLGIIYKLLNANVSKLFVSHGSHF